MGISVLMSVYEREKPQYLKRALESLYIQSESPDEIVLVEDGPIGDELENVIAFFAGGADPDSQNFKEDMIYSDKYCSKNKLQKTRPKLRTVRLAENVKLGRALETGLKHCRHEMIARMDSDDIARPDRLKLQYDYMKTHPQISAVGGEIAEFIDEGTILQIKHMPSESEKLYKYGKLRNPLNHMTVMFRKTDIENVGGYEHLPLLEDYLLWSKLLASGKKIANLPTVLVDARIDKSFADKRGGYGYFKRYKYLRKRQQSMGYTNFWEYILGILVSFVMTMQPGFMRERVYKRLRKTSNIS